VGGRERGQGWESDRGRGNDRRRGREHGGWRVPAVLLALSAIPLAAGVVRLAQLVGGAAVTPENKRFFDMPVPVVLHIVGIFGFCLLGAFQFVPSLRRRPRRWHRRAGWVVFPCGVTVALSGLWMNFSYDLPAHDDRLLFLFRLVFASAMAGFLVLGFVAARRRDFAAHRAWMMRGFAIGMGAGTQAVVMGPITLAFGDPAGVTRALLMFACWAVNLALAELLIHRRVTGRARGAAVG